MKCIPFLFIAGSVLMGMGGHVADIHTSESEEFEELD